MLTSGLRPAERAALQLAYTYAQRALPGYDSNPAVGCALIDSHGTVIAAGGHRGAGTPHAEVVALDCAGPRAKGSTAVVTLQPCGHIGHTGPCVEALIAAGVERVVYAVADPSGNARDSDDRLTSAGVDVVAAVDPVGGFNALSSWGFAHRHQRPWVVWKVAASLDGRVADGSGHSQWITGEIARAEVQRLRASVGAVVTGTGTLLADDPRLSVHDDSARPLRVVVGMRDVPTTARIHNDAGEVVHVRTRDVASALTSLWQRGVHRLLLECGPTLAGAALAADLVDEIHWHTAGILLGGANGAVAGQWPLAQAQRWRLVTARDVGGDVVSVWRRGEGA